MGTQIYTIASIISIDKGWIWGELCVCVQTVTSECC